MYLALCLKHMVWSECIKQWKPPEQKIGKPADIY